MVAVNQCYRCYTIDITLLPTFGKNKEVFVSNLFLNLKQSTTYAWQFNVTIFFVFEVLEIFNILKKIEKIVFFPKFDLWVLWFTILKKTKRLIKTFKKKRKYTKMKIVTYITTSNYGFGPFL